MSLISANEVKSFVLMYLSERTAAGNMESKPIDESFDFMDEGMMDSLGFVEMIGMIEDHFKVTVDFENMDPEKLTILDSFSCYVARNAVANGGSDKN